MAGIGLIIFVFIWGSLAVWIGGKVANFRLFKRLTVNAADGKPTAWDFPIKFLLIVFVFFLPLADEIISYPSYNDMCQDAKKYHFGSGFNAENIKGMEVSLHQESEGYIVLYPFFRKLSNYEVNAYINSSIYLRNYVVIEVSNYQLINTKTKEAVVYWKNLRPAASLFSLSWDGSKIPWLLQKCSPTKDIELEQINYENKTHKLKLVPN